jgi:hypothetical protein
MYRTGMALSAYNFLSEFKTELLNQIQELNARNDGVLQDGFNPQYVEDGWVSLKGYAWGFVVHYDEPVRIDMVVGPDWPFIGYRTTFRAEQGPGGIVWINQDRGEERYHNTFELARYGLRRLASKVGDEWVFNSNIDAIPQTIQHNPYYGTDLTPS